MVNCVHNKYTVFEYLATAQNMNFYNEGDMWIMLNFV